MLQKSHVTINANAKINLALSIVGTREDGYHLLEMVNLPIELHDVIEVNLMPVGYSTHVICDDMRLMGLRSNLCTKAIDLMKQKFGVKRDFLIRIHKNIPFSAGLGGGSSDGVAVMRAVNEILKLGLSDKDLAETGLLLGSDLPYFVLNKPAKVSGIGENVEKINVKKQYHCLLIKPERGLSTKEVYGRYKESEDKKIDIAKVIEGLENNDLEKIARYRGNDLFRPACELFPELGELAATLLKDGFPLSGMSGSGSCCFALSEDLRALKQEAKKFDKMNYEVILTRTI